MTAALPAPEIGARFGILTVLSAPYSHPAGRGRQVDTSCECGTTRPILVRDLVRGRVVTCGNRSVHEWATTHGAAGRNRTPTYQSWASMIQRCLNPKCNHWDRYGGRGIGVCESWRSFEAFLADMGERPAGRTLDRIDNDGNYEPSNCRWSTRSEQIQNRGRAPVSCPNCGTVF